MGKLKLSINQVKHVGNLAALKLSQEELGNYARQLSETLNYIDILNKLKTKKVKLTSQVTGLENISREDKTRPSLSQKQTLASASAKYQHLFKTKAIFK